LHGTVLRSTGARGIARRLGRPTAIQLAAVVLAVYLGWVAAYFATGHEIRDFIRIGPHFVGLSHRSDVIRYDPSYDYLRNRDANLQGGGYDGQFYYYLAADPENARYYMDYPGYRYLRPLYPAVARTAALGRTDLLPWTLLLVNLIAVGAGTFLLARWMEHRSQPGWPALLYGLSPGLLVAVQRDLAEPLAYALVIGAVLALDLRNQRQWVFSAVLFALAVLTRQTTAIFALVAALVLVRTHSKPKALAFLAIALLPYLTWYAIVRAWLPHTSPSGNFTPIPFAGLFKGYGQSFSRQGISFLAGSLPALGFAVVAARHLRDPTAWPAALAVVLNALAFVVLGSDSGAFPARSRILLGVALAFVWLVPHLTTKPDKRIAAAAATIWIGMLPVIFVYGLTSRTF
jgi:hypothetical protein